MVVKVALWYELWTSLMDLCWIIFLFSDLITEQALILLHIDEMEEAPNKRNALASLTDDATVEILHRLPPAPCSTANVSVASRTTSSQTTTTIGCCPGLWPASSTTSTKDIDTTLASPVNTPPCPSCPSPQAM